MSTDMNLDRRENLLDRILLADRDSWFSILILNILGNLVYLNFFIRKNWRNNKRYKK